MNPNARGTLFRWTGPEGHYTCEPRARAFFRYVGGMHEYMAAIAQGSKK